MKDKFILVTGGAGFIGSHTCISLIDKGFTPVILDNFINSGIGVIDRIFQITGVKPVLFVGDVRDSALLKEIFSLYTIQAVIHFAGSKSVAESVKKPLEYYNNNVYGAMCLFQEMLCANIKKIIFSSSATVYGVPPSSPIKENFPRKAINAYGQTKLIIEDILEDLYRSDNNWSIVKLRYFNPAGAHESGLLGEKPNGLPNNLMPYLTQVAIGRLRRLKIFGNDYNTPDGTGVRDYIHVMDLAEGHVASLNYIFSQEQSSPLSVNLGMGTGTSVLQIVEAFEKATGVKIKTEASPRRDGDIDAYWADAQLAKTILKWKAKRSIVDICEDAWRWQRHAQEEAL